MGATIYREALCSRVCLREDRQADLGGWVLDGTSGVARQNYILYVSLAQTPNQIAKSLVYDVSLCRTNLTNLVRIVYQCTKQITIALRIVFGTHRVSVYLGIVKHKTHSILSLNAKCTVSHSVLAMNTKRPAGACHPRPPMDCRTKSGYPFLCQKIFLLGISLAGIDVSAQIAYSCFQPAGLFWQRKCLFVTGFAPPGFNGGS